jgi:hypothetical protein
LYGYSENKSPRGFELKTSDEKIVFVIALKDRAFPLKNFTVGAPENFFLTILK